MPCEKKINKNVTADFWHLSTNSKTTGGSKVTGDWQERTANTTHEQLSAHIQTIVLFSSFSSDNPLH